MAAGDVQLSLDGDFCFDTTPGSPATTARTNVDEVKLSVPFSVATWLRRGSYFRGKKPTAADVSLEWKMIKFESDAFVSAVRTALLARSRVAIYAKDPAGEGMDCDAYITDWSEDQTNEGVIEITCKAEATDEARAPQYH